MVTLVIDNLSPFTPDIISCLDRLGVQYVYKKFSEATEPDLAACDKVILSGRRKNDPAINVANSRVAKNCYEKNMPLLGICYGAEIIALTFGGSIKKMPSPVRGHISVSTEPNLLTAGKQAITVYESHGFCVARLPPGFQGLASSQHCQYEIFALKSKKIYGTQFHPEKSGQDGIDLFSNFSKA